MTGAGRGLGRAIATALLDQGVRVLAVGRNPSPLESLVSAYDGGTVAVGIADMRDLDRVAELPALALEVFGRLDILVNNAGVAPAGEFLEYDIHAWQDVFSINVTGPAVLTQATGRRFIAQRAGKVINVASTAGLRGKPTLVAYSASKGALVQFTKALAAEWARHGVQVNAIAPGAFATDAQAAVLESDELLRSRIRRIPTGRMGDAHEIGPLACYLASPLSDFVTGSIFVVDGGESAKL